MNKRAVLVLFFVLCTAVLGLFARPTTAQAAPGNEWARWVIHMEFDDSKVDATMTVEIGHNTRSGVQVVEKRENFPIVCKDIGSVNIVDDVASFDGNGYLECEMPNFQEKVSQMTGGEMTIPSSCTCKQAYGLANFNFGTAAGNPFFYMDGLAFSAPTNGVASQAQYTLSVDGAQVSSEPFLVNNTMQFGGGELSEFKSGYRPTFHVDSVELGSHPSFVGGQLEIPTDQTLFLVGFDPKTGEYLSGKLGKLEIDPGCVGHGGI